MKSENIISEPSAMQAQPRQYFSEEEYLERERQAEYKSEYFGGEIFAMSGGTGAHSMVAAGIIAALLAQLHGSSCRVFTSDIRIAIKQLGKYTYPDAAVVCGKTLYRDDRNDTILNPILIVEILSPSTEAYDRGDKFRHYREIESLREYVLVSQTEPRIETFVKRDEHWMLSDAVGLDATITFDSIDCTVPLSDVYAQMEWNEE